ncbi:hypothetical protein HHK36_030105 [Tetracentron sinense]|uniref:Uncharacterized protein n=1 Tax=Tetracentron sinense TaxID=13715 RepID=A0A834YAU5_TETSI|nr:hypothetical protein HHK36_030105 [Tetracentron sinense]
MGTKVQCKSYFPGYYSMRDLNEDANSGSWPSYYEDRTLNSGQYYNSCLPRPPTDVYSGHDKEVLKQTMLKHEDIFKNQVLELHRVYRIQRDLMDEIKRKELFKHQMPVKTAQSSPFATQMPSEDAWKMWHVPSLPFLNSTCTRPSISGTDNMQSPLSFIKGNSMQTGPGPSQNGVSSKKCKLESSSKNFQRRMFDLQLPADEYLDSDEEEHFKEERVSDVSMMASCPKKNCEVAPESDVTLSLGSGRNVGCQGEASRPDLCLRSTNDLADLNECIQFEEKTTASASVDFLGPVTSHREIPVRDLSVKQDSHFLGLPKEYFSKSQKGSDNGTCSNILHLENEGNRWECLSYNFETGQSRSSLNSFPQGSCPEKLPTPFEPIGVSLKKAHELPTFLQYDQSKREPWTERAICGLKTSEKNHDLSNYNYQGPSVASHIPSPYPLGHQSDLTNSGSPLVSWRKPMNGLSQNPTAVQALPCFNTSASSSKSSNSPIQSHGLIRDNWHHHSISRLNQSFGSDVSYRNGFYQGSHSESKELQVQFPTIGFDYLNCRNHSNSASEHLVNNGPTKYFKGSECMDVKSAKDTNLNAVLHNGFQQEVVSLQDLVIIDGERKHEDPLGGLPWLRAKIDCNAEAAKGKGASTLVELDSLHDSSFQLFPNKIETGKGPNPFFVEHFTTASCSHDAEPKKIKVGDCPSIRKIFGFPIFDKSNISKDRPSSLSSPATSHCHPSEVEDNENSWKAGVCKIDLAHDPTLQDTGMQLTMVDLVVEKGLDNNLADFRYQINLNSCINEEEAQSTTVPIVKIATNIDLEAPVVSDTEAGIPPGDESIGNQHETPFQSRQNEDDGPNNELVRIAAEAIIAISSSGHNHLEDASCHPSEGSLGDALRWFAEAVSSCTSDFEGEVGVIFSGKGDGDQESSSDGYDYFESMTLKLTETKVEDYWSMSQVVENPKEEETSATLLLSRPRRGPARRGRQRRDFQRDILPGLASLSRHEVTEDLQLIGGLMRATGHHWQTGLTRRNMARNGCGRGRRRLQSSAPTVAVSRECPLLSQQPKNSELGLEERSVTGWGKTTRRPRRQRCPAGNPPLLHLTQV